MFPFDKNDEVGGSDMNHSEKRRNSVGLECEFELDDAFEEILESEEKSCMSSKVHKIWI
mgnify:CR=1 FL=1